MLGNQVSWVSAEHSFLGDLFVRLNNSGISYAVMRNHEPLPHSAGGSDLDILVAPRHGRRVKQILFEAIQAAGGMPLGVSETVGFFKIYAFGCVPVASHPWWGVRIDINVGLFFKGQHLLADGVALPVRSHNDISVLDDGFAGVLGVLKEVLNNGLLPPRYASSARSSMQHDWNTVQKLLAPMGPDGLAQLKSLILSNSPPAKLKGACRILQYAVLHHAFARRPYSSLWRRVGYEWSKVRRYLKPSGIVVAVLGVDGAGKSTVIDAILPVLNAATHNAVFIQHLRPSLLPPLASLKGQKIAPSGPVVDPHRAKPSGVLGSFVRLGYYLLDYILGYWIKIRPKVAKQPTVVIFDRYAYDMALDPRRSRIGLPGKVAGWFAALAPKPDLIFCLHGNPEVISARKQELSLEETRRQVEALRTFAKKEPRAVLISTDTSIEESRDQVLFALIKYLANISGASR